jgi:hypothetical protein
LPLGENDRILLCSACRKLFSVAPLAESLLLTLKRGQDAEKGKLRKKRAVYPFPLKLLLTPITDTYRFSTIPPRIMAFNGSTSTEEIMKKLLAVTAVLGVATMLASGSAAARDTVGITIVTPQVVHARPVPVPAPRHAEHMHGRPYVVERGHGYARPVRPMPRPVMSPRHDNDRDGVPNWRDRRPNNPYRY